MMHMQGKPLFDFLLKDRIFMPGGGGRGGSGFQL